MKIHKILQPMADICKVASDVSVLPGIPAIVPLVFDKLARAFGYLAMKYYTPDDTANVPDQNYTDDFVSIPLDEGDVNSIELSGVTIDESEC